MQANFYTMEMASRARIAESLQLAERDRMLRKAPESVGQAGGVRRVWPNPEAIRHSRVTLPRLARLFAR